MNEAMFWVYWTGMAALLLILVAIFKPWEKEGLGSDREIELEDENNEIEEENR